MYASPHHRNPLAENLAGPREHTATFTHTILWDRVREQLTGSPEDVGNEYSCIWP